MLDHLLLKFESSKKSLLNQDLAIRLVHKGGIFSQVQRSHLQPEKSMDWKKYLIWCNEKTVNKTMSSY